MDDQLYLRSAAAYIIGELGEQTIELTSGKELSDLSQTELNRVVEAGRDKGLRVHRFKRTMGLPRVTKVLGILKALYPQSMLDIGTGRGVFLWPLLDLYPDVQVTCADILDYRYHFLCKVKDGGLDNIHPVLGDIKTLEFKDGCFDVITFLETLEHIPEPEKALLNALRMAGRALILSVPSKEDDNPEHIHLLDESFFRDTLLGHADCSVSFEYVPNHMIVLVLKK